MTGEHEPPGDDDPEPPPETSALAKVLKFVGITVLVIVVGVFGLAGLILAACFIGA